jgi:hypothetical protein
MVLFGLMVTIMVAVAVAQRLTQQLLHFLYPMGG